MPLDVSLVSARLTASGERNFVMQNLRGIERVLTAIGYSLFVLQAQSQIHKCVTIA
jgi:hypothetical protein